MIGGFFISIDFILFIEKNTMILIDKTKSQQQIVLTLSELTTIQDPKYLMVLENDATRDIFKIYLPDNDSASTDRYDLFNIETSVFFEITNGFYSYAIHEQSLTDDENSPLTPAIETGKLIVQGAKHEVEIISPIRTNEYRIYE